MSRNISAEDVCSSSQSINLYLPNEYFSEYHEPTRYKKSINPTGNRAGNKAELEIKRTCTCLVQHNAAMQLKEPRRWVYRNRRTIRRRFRRTGPCEEATSPSVVPRPPQATRMSLSQPRVSRAASATAGLGQKSAPRPYARPWSSRPLFFLRSNFFIRKKKKN